MSNNNKIKVSIVVPVYNVEAFIKQCLDSLINQTLKEIEIILINDCSPDNCGIICDEYAAKDNRVTVIHNEKNIKQAHSSNKGIENASGEYLGFVDPDDWVDIDYFEKLYNAAKKNNSDIAKTERIKVFSDGSSRKQTDVNKKIKKGLKKGHPIFILYTNEHTTAIFKRSIIINNEVVYPNIRNGLDNIFLLKATYFSNSIRVISGTYYYYRQHSNSAISVKEKPYFESILQYVQLLFNFLNKHEMEKQFYDLLFLKGFNSVRTRYKEIGISPDFRNYKEEYVENTLKLLNQYKYEKEYLFDSIFYGLTYKGKSQQIKTTYIYRIIKTIRLFSLKILRN